MPVSIKQLVAKRVRRPVSIGSLLKHDGKQSMSVTYTISKVAIDEQLVTGAIYIPNILDSHGHYMNAAELKKTAYNFLANGMNSRIDVQHNNRVINACLVESYIARANDPDGYAEGTWVGTTQINDDEAWQAVKNGDLNGYSFEIMTYKRDTSVVIESASWYYGFTDPDPYDKHTHPFLVRMDEKGEIAWGATGEGSNGSAPHPITKSSVTDEIGGHTHRYHLG